MPAIYAILDTGKEIVDPATHHVFHSITQKERVEVMKVSTAALETAVNDGKINVILHDAVEKAQKIADEKGQQLTGVYISAKSLHRIKLYNRLYRAADVGVCQ